MASVQADGTLTRSIMGEEIVAMAFTLDRKVDFKTNDTVEVYGNTYTMLVEPTVEEVSSMEFKYSLNFVSVKYNLAKAQYFFPDKDNNLTLSEHSSIATAKQLLDLLVQNANRLTTGWTVGTVDTTTAKQVDFNGDNCLSALAKIAEAFDIEYWVDGNKSIHLTKRNAISGYTFGYGKTKGLTSLTRTPFNDSTLVTRVYAKGSDKNIAGNYRNYSKHLKMAVPYLEKNTTIHGVIEHTETFDDVYPHREGTVTAVNASNPLQFTDTGIDFDLNAKDASGNTTILINNVSAKVTFNSGQLAGYTFEIKKNGYNHATKTIELLVNKDEKDITVPSNLLRPAIGDKYVITDIIMPPSYVANAEALLQQKAQEYLNENCEQRFVYSPKLDKLYLESLNANILLGNSVKLVAPEFNLNENLRVVKITRNLQDKFDVTIEVAEKAVLSQIVLNHIAKEKQTALIIQRQSYNEQLAKRSYLFAREFFDKAFDNEGYFDPERIKPASIHTGMIAVGSKMQQFNLVDVKLEITNNNTALTNTAGKLVHLTLESTPRTWNLPANSFTNISSDFNYIYAKAEKVGTNVTLLVTPNKIMVDSDLNFYHFMVGELSSVIDGFRRIKTLHGFTLISPNEITTGRWSSPYGTDYIEYGQTGIDINANVTFRSGSPAINQISEKTLQSLKIGVHNLLVDSQFATKYYQMDADKRARYFDQEQTYTLSVDATCKQNFLGKIYAIGKNIKIRKFEVLGSEDATLDANIRKRIKVTFKAVLKYYSQITCKIQNEQDNIPLEIVHPKLELGNIASDWDYASEDLKKEVKKEVREVTHSLEGFQDVVHGAFKDGIIDMAEAKALEKYINLLNTEKADIDKKYQEIYNDSYIMSYAKSNLLAKKVAYDASHNVLISAVSYAIGTGKATAQQKEDVDRKFGLYKTSLASLRQAFEYALKSIETNKANQAESKAKNHATVINSNLANGAVARNTLSASQALAKSEAALAVANGGTMSPEDAVTLANIKAVTEKLTLKTDYINETKINGNTVCTGVLQVGNQHGANAFISGVDTGASAPRFGAGVNWFNRYTAPFRVTDDGSLYATKANITGNINATSGSFSGNISALSGNIGKFQIDSNGLAKSYDSGYVGYGATLNSDKIELNKRVGIGTPSMYNGYNYYTNTITGNEIVLQAGSNKVVISATGITINGRNL